MVWPSSTIDFVGHFFSVGLGAVADDVLVDFAHGHAGTVFPVQRRVPGQRRGGGNRLGLRGRLLHHILFGFRGGFLHYILLGFRRRLLRHILFGFRCRVRGFSRQVVVASAGDRCLIRFCIVIVCIIQRPEKDALPPIPECLR